MIPLNDTHPPLSVIAAAGLEYSSEPLAPVLGQMNVSVAFPGERDTAEHTCRPTGPVSLSVVTVEVLARREQLAVAAVIVEAQITTMRLEVPSTRCASTRDFNWMATFGLWIGVASSKIALLIVFCNGFRHSFVYGAIFSSLREQFPRR